MRLAFFAVLSSLLLLAGCGGSDPTRSDDITPLTAIEIVSTRSTIAAGTSLQFSALGNFSGRFTRDITDQVTWDSQDAGVASFATIAGSPGRIQALAAGQTTVTASFDGITSPAVQLTVSNATLNSGGLTISPQAPNQAAGLTVDFAATGTFSDNSTQDLTFDVDWASSVTTVATIRNAPPNKGRASCLAAGTSEISAAFGAEGAAVTLTVTAPSVQSISLSPEDGAVLSLANRSFTATGSFSDGNTADITGQVTWSSSNTAFATIDASGTVTGRAPGTVTIQAALAGVSASTSLEITGGSLVSIALVPPAPLTVVLQVPRRLQANGVFSNGTTRDITRQVVWSTLNTAVAGVGNSDDQAGVVTGVGLGTTSIRTRFDATLEPTFSLAVNDGNLLSLEFGPVPAETLITGTSRRLTVSGVYDGGNANQDLTELATWVSGAPAVASVEATGRQGGRVRALAAGTTEITASRSGPGGTPVTTAPPLSQTVIAAAIANNGLAITPLNPSTGPGGSVQMAASATFAGGDGRDVTQDVTWSISNQNVGVFPDANNRPGLLYGVRAGTAVITATFQGQTATVNLTVP